MKRIYLNELSLEELKALFGEVVREELLKQIKPTPPDEKFYSKQEVCSLLNLSLSSLNSYIKQKRIIAKRLNGRVILLHSDVMNSLKTIGAEKGSRQRGY